MLHITIYVKNLKKTMKDIELFNQFFLNQLKFLCRQTFFVCDVARKNMCDRHRPFILSHDYFNSINFLFLKFYNWMVHFRLHFFYQKAFIYAMILKKLFNIFELIFSN